MSEERAFRDAMAADHSDAHTRLVYADWLDEHDQSEAARRLRWWGHVLLHMPTGSKSIARGHSPAMNIHLPEWATRLTLVHFNRSLGYKDADAAQDELHALGLAPEPHNDPLEPSYASPSRWIRMFADRPSASWNRATHAVAAQQIAERIGQPVKLAAIPPPDSTGSVLVRVPVPQSVPNRTTTPAPAPVATPRGPTFFLPG